MTLIALRRDQKNDHGHRFARRPSIEAISLDSSLDIPSNREEERTIKMIRDQYGGISLGAGHYDGEKQTSKPRMQILSGRQGTIQNLERLGFGFTKELKALAASSTSKLGDLAEAPIDLCELDQAMAKYAIEPLHRIRFKNDLMREGLLK